MFKLHEKLESDLTPIGESELSLIFVLPDSEVPWVILVPKVAGIKEFHHLSSDDQVKLGREINKVSLALESCFSPDKINIGSLGNMVPQLHIHLICRFKEDRAWPGAIWGTSANTDELAIDTLTQKIQKALNL